jgi:hypothetical protein
MGLKPWQGDFLKKTVVTQPIKPREEQRMAVLQNTAVVRVYVLTISDPECTAVIRITFLVT